MTTISKTYYFSVCPSARHHLWTSPGSCPLLVPTGGFQDGDDGDDVEDGDGDEDGHDVDVLTQKGKLDDDHHDGDCV